MFASGDFNDLLGQVLAQLGVDRGTGGSHSGAARSSNGPISGKGGTGSNGNANNCPTGKTNINIAGLTPSSALVIAGLLTGVLEVDSVLVDRNQGIQVVVVGSLKRKTPLDKMMEQIGPLPFDDVMQAITNRFK